MRNNFILPIFKPSTKAINFWLNMEFEPYDIKFRVHSKTYENET